jgi:hypothetical protein
MASENQRSKTLGSANIFAMSLGFGQQHDAKLYFSKQAENGGPIQADGSKSDF